MKKFVVAAIYALVLIGILAWNTREKYLAGTGVFYDIKVHGFDGPVAIGIVAGLLVIVGAIYLGAKRRR